jgi:hypothetical protein
MLSWQNVTFCLNERFTTVTVGNERRQQLLFRTQNRVKLHNV